VRSMGADRYRRPTPATQHQRFTTPISGLQISDFRLQTRPRHQPCYVPPALP
jgi:hypothetical protein